VPAGGLGFKIAPHRGHRGGRDLAARTISKTTPVMAAATTSSTRTRRITITLTVPSPAST